MTAAAVPRTWREVSRYASAVRWFASILWEHFRWRVVTTIVATQVGVLVIGAGLSLSLTYFQQLEQDGTVQVRGLSLTARDEATLVAVVAVVLVVLLSGAAILFLAQRRIVDMAVQLNHLVRMRIALAYGGELPTAADWGSERSMLRALWQLQTRDARRVAIVARSMLRNLVSLGTVVVGLGALLYLDAVMTLLFLAVMAVAMVSYYRNNAASARATRDYEAVAPTTRQGLRRLLPSLQTVSQPAPDRAELDAALDQDAVAEETRAFGDRFGAHIHAEFLGFAIMGVALAGLTGVMGRQALAGAMPWTRLVGYVLVLRLTINGIQSLLRTFAFFSRFYPSIDRLNRFFAATNPETSDEPVVTLALRTDERTLVEDGTATGPLAPGEVVEVVLPVPLSRYSLGLLASLLVGDEPGRRRRLLGQTTMAAPLTPPPTPASMRTLFQLDGRLDPDGLRARLGGHATAVEEAVGLDPDVAVPPQAWEHLPQEALDHLLLVAAEQSPRPVLALHERLATASALARLREQCDKVVLVCSTGPPEDPREHAVDRVVVGSSAGDVVAVGTPGWVARIWPELDGSVGDDSDTERTLVEELEDDED